MSLRKTVYNSGFVIYYIFLVLGAILLASHEKGAALLWINKNHSEIMDQFFKYWTHLGDGFVFAVLLIFFLFVSFYKSIVLVLAVISQTIIIQVLKRFVFSDVVRPKLYFDNFIDLHPVDGVNIHAFNSFPSGHTATAFTAAVILSLYFKNKYATGLLIITAILVGLSRVYLLQHFFIDIYFGSIIGFLNGVLAITWMESTSLSKNQSLHRGLIKK